MSRPVLLLLDPVGARRKLFARVLRMEFDLLVPKSMREVRQLMEEQFPDVVLASTQQKRGHGLEVCTRLRRLEGGDCLMVVHGTVPEDASAEELKKGLGSKYKVDHWLPNNASPAMVALTIKQLLKTVYSRRPRRPRTPMPSPPSMSISSEVSGRHRAVTSRLRTTGEFEVEFARTPTLKRKP